MTQTQAIRSHPFSLYMGDGSTPETFQRVPEVGDITSPSGEREEIDVTSHDSTAKEYLMGLKDYGDCTFPINWIPGNAIHKALWDAAEDDEPTNFQIKDDPTTPTMTLAFAALVKTQPTMDFPIDEAVTAEVTLRVTGDVLMTVTGSGS